MTLPTPPSSPEPSRVLTPRQEKVLRLMLSGATAQQIADELSISRATVQTHLRAIYGAFGVKSRALAVIVAIERGYLPRNVDPVWMQDRERVLRALRQAWSPCWAHPVYAPSCAVCVRAATLTQAMMLVRDPSRVPQPPTAEPPSGGSRPTRPTMLGPRPLPRPGGPPSAPEAAAGRNRRAAS